MGWSLWKPIAEASKHPGAAVYQVRAKTSNGKVFAVARMLGEDANGLLTIGKTGRMEGRRRNFVRGLKVKRGHSEGCLLGRLLRHTELANRVGASGVEYRFAEQPSEVAATEAEHSLLSQYLLRFGELPPLNSAIPSRHDEATWCCGRTDHIEAVQKDQR